MKPCNPILLALILALASAPARADRSFSKPVAKGVLLQQWVQEAPNTPRIVTAVEVDMTQPGLSVGAELGLDDVESDGKTGGREAVSTFARRKRVTVAVNGDFFIGGAPVGLLIRNGELVTLPYLKRVVCAILPGNRIVFDIPTASGTVRAERGPSLTGDPAAPATQSLTSVNRKRGANAFVLYTPTYGPKTLTNNFGTEVVLSGVALPLKPGSFSGTVEEVRAGRGGTPLRRGRVVLSGHGPASAFLKSLQPGDTVRVSLRVSSPQIPDWSVVREAMGGGPYLVRGGKVSIDALEQRFQPDVVLGRAPRSAVGRTRDGRLLLVAVDGRQPLSAGVTLKEMAELMLRLGCETAINLDGGGSTAMAIQGVRVNSPSDGWERSVAAIMSIQAPALADTELAGRSNNSGPAAQNAPVPFNLLSEMEGTISSGQSVAFEPRDENGEPLNMELPFVWGVEGPVGFVDQSGYFTAGKAGAGKVVARWGKQSADIDVRVVPSRTPAAIAAAWLPPDLARPTASTLTVTVSDASGNRIPGLPVSLALPVGSAADTLTRPTDEKGMAVFQVVWGEGVSRRLSVKAGAMSVTPPEAPASPLAPPISPGSPLAPR